MSFFKVNNRCTGCLACVQNCPAGALENADEGNRRIILHNMTKCARCGNCWRVCPEGAIEFQHLIKGKWEEVATMELVRCAICGEPIYTVPFGETLERKLDRRVDALCPHHRQTVSLTAWKHLAPERMDSDGAGN